MSKNTKHSKLAKKAHKKPKFVHPPDVRRSKLAKSPESKAVGVPDRTAAPISLNRTPKQQFVYILTTQLFAKMFALASVGVLLVTTLFWSILSANIHQSNADQLIDAYLFENLNTFQQANFPGTHSFFIKWPLFIAMNVYRNTPDTFMVATVLMVLATLSVLVYMLYKIETRLVAFGLLCLALSSILLLVPAQPYPGALLPVNMAMTTTRNLEYAAFVLAMYYAVQIKSLRSRRVWMVAALLIAVIASDNLFGVLAIGGGLAALLWFRIVRCQPENASTIIRWLLIVVGSIFTAKLLLYGLTTGHITNIVNESRASPFELVHSSTKLALGIIYGVSSILTNFGANPVHSVVVVQELPRELLASFKKISIIPYVVNFVLICIGLYAAVRLLLARSSDHWSRISIVLIGSTVTAFAVYVLTDHYYPVDARYLTISLFAVSIASATFFRGVQLRMRYAGLIAGLIIAVLPIGVLTTWQEFRASESAMSKQVFVTSRVSEELQRRKIDTLIGNYWEVTPVKGATERTITIAPVDNCTMPRPVLNSGAWFNQKLGTPAAYLAVKDPGSMNRDNPYPTYNGCSLANVVSAYGVPSERVAIGEATSDSSTADVLLLLYPDGIHNKSSKQLMEPSPKPTKRPEPVTVGPPQLPTFVPFSELNPCGAGTTLQVVAHEDDDLLFMNPDVQRSITEKRCIRTVFMTAGDAGAGTAYWESRERGSKAAYAKMYGVPNTWKDQRQILNGQSMVVSYLDGVSTVSLVYMRLPDGNMRGEGFADRQYSSLLRLVQGLQTAVGSVDNVGTYNKQQIVDSLHEIMAKDLPDEIRTQGTDNQSDGDHSDHYASGVLARLAADNYLQTHTMFRYMGYPMKELPVNLNDDTITLKQSAFLAYAEFDGAVCQSVFECQNTITYGSYLTRQYLQP